MSGLRILKLALPFLFGLCLSFVSLRTLSQEMQAEQHAWRGLQLARSGKLRSAELELRRAIALDPNNAGYLADLGGVLGMERNLPEAETFFRKALQLDPGNPTLRRNLAANEWQLGRLVPAEKNLEQLLQDQPGDRSSTLLLGMVEANLRNYRKAARLLASVPDLVSQHPESLAALARSYYHTGQTDRARNILSSITSHFTDPRSVFLAGVIAEEGRDPKTAESLFKEVRNTYPETPRLLYHLAHAEYLAGSWNDCQRLLSQLIDTGYRNNEIYNLLGRCDAKQNKMADAVKAYQTAIAASPSSESDYLNLAYVLSDHGLRDAAIQTMSACIKALPDSFHCYTEKGRIEESQHYYKQSVVSFSRATQLNGSSADAEFGLAGSLAGLGKHKEAEAAYQAAIRLNPRRPEFYDGYAKLLLDETGQNGAAPRLRAESLLEKANSLDPSGGESRLLLGELWFDEGKTTLAVPLLKTAARLDPENGRPHYLLWRAYQKLGRDDQAASELAQFKTLSMKQHEPRARAVTR
jgi:tetratricopeptide (TPR) repeat protein